MSTLFAAAITSAFYTDEITYESILSIVSSILPRDLMTVSHIAPELLIFHLGKDADVTIEPSDKLLKFCSSLVELYNQCGTMNEIVFMNGYEKLLSDKEQPESHLQLGAVALANMTRHSEVIREHFLSSSRLATLCISSESARHLFLVHTLSLNKAWDLIGKHDIVLEAGAFDIMHRMKLLTGPIITFFNSTCKKNLCQWALGNIKRMKKISTAVSVEDYSHPAYTTADLISICCIYGYRGSSSSIPQVESLPETTVSLLKLLDDLRRGKWKNKVLVESVLNVAGNIGRAQIVEYIRLQTK